MLNLVALFLESELGAEVSENLPINSEVMRKMSNNVNEISTGN